MEEAKTEEQFEGWAVVEMMGHRKLGGFIKPVTYAGAPMLRIDVPGEDGKNVATQYVSPAALYAVTPCSEDVARALAKARKPEPVTRWELPADTRPSASSRTVEPDAYDPDGEF